MDLKYMKRALELSKRGTGMTCPNPMVGAVIVKNGRVIGEGWHHGPGLPHAEIEALRACSEDPAGATMYVTLEPCNHFGRTPPCTEAIIRAGIAAVKFAVSDPHSIASGGAARLREAGINVEEGFGRRQALELNRRFFHFCRTGRPWVIMKAAMSLDAKITSASGTSQWITGAAARRRVHRLRSEVSAVMVGIETVLSDDPQLTNRMVKPIMRQPLKVVIDSRLRLPIDSKLVREAPGDLIVICAGDAPPSNLERLQGLGVRIIRQEQPGRVDLDAALNSLGEYEIQSVLAEGGGALFTSLVEFDLVHEYYLFYAPFFIGGTASKGVVAGYGLADLAAARRLTVDSARKIGADILIHAYKEDAEPCLPG
jgi:diaminohydroxyphosphoribosylaminopyrimidine deaminase/5-amino-6-(5-phosphoribosylamino)uracil reductase